MSQYNSSAELDSQKCSGCKKMLTPNMFYRRGTIWKTCNACSALHTARRKEETAGRQQAQIVWPGHRTRDPLDDYAMALDRRLRELQDDYARQQQAFEHQQQQQFELRSTDPSTALDYLLSPTFDFEPSPQEIYEQQLRMNGINTAMDLNQDAGQGMIPASEDPNISADVRAFLTELEQMPQERFDFEEYATNELQGEYFYLTGEKYDGEPYPIRNSNLDDQMDIDSLTAYQIGELMEVDSTHQDTTVQQLTTPAAPEPLPLSGPPLPLSGPHQDTTIQHFTTPAAPEPLSLSEFFGSFRATQDLLRQPESSEHGLTGEALVTHLISEYGLSVRLEALFRRWSGHDGTGHGKLHHFYQELYAIHQMEVKQQCTPWTPLSGWLVIYEQEFTVFAESYELFAQESWQAKRKYQARKLRLSKQLKIDLRDTFTEQMESTEQELCKALVELTGRTEREVKHALQVELRAVARKVKNDCLNKGILFMDMDRFGKYKFAEEES